MAIGFASSSQRDNLDLPKSLALSIEPAAASSALGHIPMFSVPTVAVRATRSEMMERERSFWCQLISRLWIRHPAHARIWQCINRKKSLSATMTCLAGEMVTVSATLDHDDGWDFLNDAHFDYRFVMRLIARSLRHFARHSPVREGQMNMARSQHWGATTAPKVGEVHRQRGLFPERWLWFWSCLLGKERSRWSNSTASQIWQHLRRSSSANLSSWRSGECSWPACWLQRPGLRHQWRHWYIRLRFVGLWWWIRWIRWLR